MKLQGGPYAGEQCRSLNSLQTLTFTARGQTGSYNHNGIWTAAAPTGPALALALGYRAETKT